MCGEVRVSAGELNAEQIEQILNQAKEAGIEWIYFEGGEPFIYYDVLVLHEVLNGNKSYSGRYQDSDRACSSEVTMIRTERKYIEILRILKEHKDPTGAKRLSEMMAERGFVLSDRAVQYYLSYLDSMGFTEKIGNQGRILTPLGLAETDNALVDDRIGFIISKLERLAYRSTFDPVTGPVTLHIIFQSVREESADQVKAAFDEVIKSGCGFFNSYRIIDHDPRVLRDLWDSSHSAVFRWTESSRGMESR